MRQCGKTVLVRSLLKTGRPYFTPDDATTLTSAKSDPVGFIRQINTAILDEVQRAPELLRAIKSAVDNDRRGFSVPYPADGRLEGDQGVVQIDLKESS